MSEVQCTSNEPCTRSVYLITYSQADIEIVPDKATFITFITDAFNKNGTAKLIQYACAEEKHANGNVHYHAVVKLDKMKRWKGVRNYLSTKYNINVQFTNQFTNYYDGYQYVMKDDKNVLHSDNHPDLSNPPRTAQATQARRQGIVKRSRTRSFDAVDFADVVEKYHIRDKTELLNVVKKQKTEGKRDLALYVLNNVDKSIKIIKTVWDMNNAEKVLKRRNVERMQLLQSAVEGECSPNCEGRWITLAKETLANNGIEVRKFAGSVSETIENGRGKDNNLLLIGTGNCGKTFLLKPLNDIFKTFKNPASGSFAWLGVENAEVIFLNDFRWDSSVIPWKDFLLLLEGDDLHFSAPKTTYSEDIYFDKDTPIFATADDCFKKSQSASIENYMMTLRWKIYKFTYEIPQQRIVKIKPCSRCFAELVLHN